MHARKAKVSIPEIRNTPSPALVTQVLLPLLEAIGSAVDVPRLRKRIRDDVSIHKTKLPWRRLPSWLILRVSTQRQLSLMLGNHRGRACYKVLLCTVFAQLLVDCAGQLAPELTLLLRSKLCRRLAKLEMDKANVPPEDRPVYQQLLASTSNLFKDAILSANSQVELAWSSYKKQITPSVPRLPLRASKEALRLSLANSGSYLDSLLCLKTVSQGNAGLVKTPSLGDAMAPGQFQGFTDQCYKLAKLEAAALESQKPVKQPSAASGCTGFAKDIVKLIRHVKGTLESNSEQVSVSLLALFSLWVKMDRCVTMECPLLLDYHPGFDPELLDVLQLSTLWEMEQVQKIQEYLRDRCGGSRSGSGSHHGTRTILSPPDEDCFASQFVARSASLKELQQQIEAESQKLREQAEARWTKARELYDDLTEKLFATECVCKKERGVPRDVSKCDRCAYRKRRKGIRVPVHEELLPADPSLKATVVFELGIPVYLAAYRGATWSIINQFAHPGRPSLPSSSPAIQLREYQPLKPFGAARSKVKIISLASTKKPFLRTHYKEIKMKVGLSAVLRPNGLDLQLYDASSKTWVADLDRPLTLSHLCGIHIPRGLQGSVLPPQAHPLPDPDGPSSYETVASQYECPPDMSIHEFMSYLRLLSGRSRRWLSILAELGSPNLNLNSEDSMHLFSQLAIQVGPMQHHTGVLRDVHVVFQDKSFCDRLAEQIRNRLRSLHSNWRETYCMETLIALSLRLFRLAAPSERGAAMGLIEIARTTTLGWISRLREELWNCADAVSAEGLARYGFWAGLLCRRTFAVFDGSGLAMTAKDLGDFVQASVALQQNLVVDLQRLSPTLKHMLARDMKAAYKMQDTIKMAIKGHHQSLGDAINKAWSDSVQVADASHPTESTFGHWQFLKHGGRWVECETVPTMAHVSAQKIRYNFVEGQLLVNGSAIGKLPPDIRDSEDVKELFGDQYLLTFPSPYRGMSHRLTKLQPGHQQVHFGLRGRQVVIRAVAGNTIYEYVPRRVFLGASNLDLPLSLVENCTHWLNLHSRRLEIRRRPQIWKTRSNDWVLDVDARQARRSKVHLVDLHSKLGQTIASILGSFEDVRKLTIFQPLSQAGALSVELRNLDLSFFVNSKGLLQCRELHAEIDPDQDAGTLYGFQSKLVLRGADGQAERSIITPLGPVRWIRDGIHVCVRAGSAPDYAKFSIDSVLGRLTCAPEPRLLHAKALFHALTSFPLPDILTRRTGTEEAIHTLKSGCCQPWQPLSDITTLMAIKNLAPERVYYPRDKRCLQAVTWDDSLTVTIQHESYDRLVGELLAKSDRLRAFAESGTAAGLEEDPPSLLRRRAEAYRYCYERGSSQLQLGQQKSQKCSVYQPRDREASSPPAARVFQIAKLLCDPSPRIHLTRSLNNIFQGSARIGGFASFSGRGLVPLADLIGGDIKEQWGYLVDVCRGTDEYRAMFTLALLAFTSDPDLNLIKSLVALARLDQVRSIPLPLYPYFTCFKEKESPTIDSLRAIISSAYLESTWTLPDSQSVSYEQMANQIQSEHLEQCGQENNRLAAFLVAQWPCAEPSVWDFETEVIDLQLAMSSILPEWRRLYQNRQLSEYFDRIQDVLGVSYQGKADTSTPRRWDTETESFYVSRSDSVIPSLSRHLFAKSVPIVRTLPADAPDTLLAKATVPPAMNLVDWLTGKVNFVRGRHGSREESELASILSLFVTSPDVMRQQYGRDLEASLASFQKTARHTEAKAKAPSIGVIDNLMSDARSAIGADFWKLAAACSAGQEDARFWWLHQADLWPCISPVTVLELLRVDVRSFLGTGVKELLVSYGVNVTRLQRFRRIQAAQLRQDASRVLVEWRNNGHENWNPLEIPDWLLLEIDSNMLIRPEQVTVARAIISPASGFNSVLQMNMGKGKTSCIVPMAMSILADASQLARLIVPKALLLQTAQIVQARLGGLVGREVRHIPFSRRTPTGPAAPGMVPLYTQLHEEIRRSRGIILAIPEHILSFKLSGLQRLADARLAEAKAMIAFQTQLSNTCRDVLDESDFTLAVKTQLVYPSGPQLAVDGHPHRWKITQTLLSVVEYHLRDLAKDLPRGLEVFERLDGFPMAHFLQEEAEDELHRRVVEEVSSGRSELLNFTKPTTASVSRDLIRRVLSEPSIEPNLVQSLATHFSDAEVAYSSILLIRGLLVKEILLHCLKKRWNVQYGFHPRRHPIAVPFEAKGIPSEQSEFGHPDVVIILTCLSFYYSGVTAAQFRQGLMRVLRSEDPAAEYDRWTQGSVGLPEHLRHWNVINLDDQEQFDQLWNRLRLNRNVLNHYMNHFVFPAHAKQFGVKIQASGWDLPLFSPMPSAQTVPGARTTGFSGTNDNKMMLPLTIRQDDLEDLSQTNAEVLTYLLQPRNREYCRAPWRVDREERLLEELARKGIRILIDAGAYVLERDNQDLAKEWLSKDTRAKAAVYFGVDNRAWVRYRNSDKRVPLIATPFVDSLDECLVYLDEAHTRGVDLKLPAFARGALTLALGQTKDHTVQGKIWHLLFISPGEKGHRGIGPCD